MRLFYWKKTIHLLLFEDKYGLKGIWSYTLCGEHHLFIWRDKCMSTCSFPQDEMLVSYSGLLYTVYRSNMYVQKRIFKLSPVIGSEISNLLCHLWQCKGGWYLSAELASKLLKLQVLWKPNKTFDSEYHLSSIFAGYWFYVLCHALLSSFRALKITINRRGLIFLVILCSTNECGAIQRFQ